MAHSSLIQYERVAVLQQRVARGRQPRMHRHRLMVFRRQRVDRVQAFVVDIEMVIARIQLYAHTFRPLQVLFSQYELLRQRSRISGHAVKAHAVAEKLRIDMRCGIQAAIPHHNTADDAELRVDTAKMLR